MSTRRSNRTTAYPITRLYFGTTCFWCRSSSTQFCSICNGCIPATKYGSLVTLANRVSDTISPNDFYRVDFCSGKTFCGTDLKWANSICGKARALYTFFISYLRVSNRRIRLNSGKVFACYFKYFKTSTNFYIAAIKDEISLISLNTSRVLSTLKPIYSCFSRSSITATNREAAPILARAICFGVTN